ncbi:TetR/AcrR family transcriptional regulator [Ammoniphilus sp. CFH 90114]|uniref:TetR/AcrR family transcriptional regulator n=1 Tax=Ammoniphilus sp. CFH 90114 TaxID=2493665 RepID=UPI0013E941B9|nr:TetR/AcrR family transcriptional regulator [Ammoniphilus sp. CFH 90114]
MARTVKRPEERRLEIIQAAANLFSVKGYEKTAVNDIIQDIGVAKGTFYHYFNSKEEIADAVIQMVIQESIPVLREIERKEGVAAVEKLLQVTEAFSAKATQAYRDGLMNHLHQEGHSVFHQKMKVQMIKDYVPILTSIVEQGVREGQFHTLYPQQITEFLLVGLHFMLDPSLFACSKEQFNEKVKAVSEIYEKMLGTAPGSFSLVSVYLEELYPAQ